MTSKEAWNIFKKTGNINDYLKYKDIQRKESKIS